MILKHRIEYVDGDIDTDNQKLSCGGNKKYGTVALCFDCGMSIGFAPIKLHSKDLAKDADAVYEDAHKLGEEIAKRWNNYQRLLSLIEGLECECDGLIIPCQSQICRAKEEARKIKGDSNGK